MFANRIDENRQRAFLCFVNTTETTIIDNPEYFSKIEGDFVLDWYEAFPIYFYHANWNDYDMCRLAIKESFSLESAA